MVLRAVLSAQADRVSRALGARSGVEMRAARRAAEAVGAQLVLGGNQASASPLSFRMSHMLLWSLHCDTEAVEAQVGLGGTAHCVVHPCMFCRDRYPSPVGAGC